VGGDRYSSYYKFLTSKNKNTFNQVNMTDKSLSVQSKAKPKICAIDLEEEVVEALRATGLYCFSGTLGSLVEVPNLGRRDSHPCLLNSSFPPNLHEYDIVIVDLKDRESIKYIESEHTHKSFKGSSKTLLLSSYPETVFDPRPLSSSILGEELKQFFSDSTLIIVFCSSDETCEYHPIEVTRNSFEERGSVKHSLYDFIPLLKEICNSKVGLKTMVLDVRKEMKSFLTKYNESFIYKVVFRHPTMWLQKEGKNVKRQDFVPLLVNSNDQIVGFIDLSLNSSVVLAFPQLQNRKKDFLLELIDELLPGLFPEIFPYSEQFSWVSLESYFLPNQADLLAKKVKLEDEYKSALMEIENDIEENHAQYKFLHNLITETGDLLVKAVEELFIWFGFKSILNMDETNPEIKEEDLQVPLENGLLVIEVKGIGGTSKDSECSQISKIKYRRAKERNSFDVFALYIVNHQRYTPPSERRNPPFSEQQIADAQSDGRGLLTTYEIFRLYFHIEEGFITKEEARLSLLEHGLVQFKPVKSHLIGYPLEVHHKGQVVILNVFNLALHNGSSIIVCNGEVWFRVKVLEIKLNDEIVESVSEGEIGMKLSRGVLKTSELWLEDASVDVT